MGAATDWNVKNVLGEYAFKTGSFVPSSNIAKS